MNHFFAILGGMGTLATESFMRVLNSRTPTTNDQDYLDYIVVNHASVPDRSTYILDQASDDPGEALVADVLKFSPTKPDFFVLTCNTAHYFYDQMQAATSIPILHMPKLTVAEIHHITPTAKRVGILATPGTLNAKIYDSFLEAAGYEVVKPTPTIIQETEALIFTDIKGSGQVNATRFHHLLAQMQSELHCDITILGCTELSLAQEQAGNHPYPVADAQSILADHTLALALQQQKFN